MAFRIAVFTAALSHHVTRTIDKVAVEHSDAELLVLLHRPKRRARRLLRNQWRNLKRHGWRWLPYQAGEILQGLARRSADGAPWQPPARVTVAEFPSVNGPDAVAALRDFAPDLGLSLAAPILKPAAFEAPRLGTLNIHKGALPGYRGMPPAFWELWNGEAEVGVTVHKVEAGLDSGDILLEARVPVERHSTPAGLRVRLDELGVTLIAEAARRLRDGSARFTPQPPGGHTNTRPKLAQEAALRRRTAPVPLSRRAKDAVFAGYAALKPRDPERVVVLLYHRVSDAFRDSVTVGVEQFDTQMRYLKDHAQLVGLDALVRGDLPADGPVVAVSFDDGYRDNYENAAPILVKRGVPATFFISTDKVERNLPFEHDLAKLGFGLPNMGWDEVEEMHREGLAFGSHTANHINLAKSDPALVEDELARSRDALKARLGLEEVLFAYPFGKRADISPERLEQVKAAGYAGNCSAYGGVNARAVDRWDIRRQGVDHSFGVAALKAKIAGWKAKKWA